MGGRGGGRRGDREGRGINTSIPAYGGSSQRNAMPSALDTKSGSMHQPDILEKKKN